ncbi:MAG: hypothetical protein INR73_08660 [Williamsia sp.]|nr:hypothetical protein [Williamsia sp.]
MVPQVFSSTVAVLGRLICYGQIRPSVAIEGTCRDGRRVVAYSVIDPWGEAAITVPKLNSGGSVSNCL